MLNYGFEFKKLNDSRHDMGEFCEPSLWPELVPTERFLVSRHECWLASDLAKIVNVTDDEKYMDDISLCNAFYGATPKKFQPHNPNAMTELKKQHIYRLDNNDVELSRYACWTLLKDMESEIPTTFFQTYFLIPNATLQYLNQATDAMNRISLRQTVAKYQKQMAGIMKSFKVKQGKYYANLNNLVARWLFGNLKSNDIRDEYNIYQNKPLADYMNDKLLATYATALKKIIDTWDNDAPSHEYTTLYGIIYNEMTSARKNFQFGRPEDNFVFKLNKINKKKQPISVHDVEKWKKMRESEFTKKYITEKVR
jgi:hypothetical protein